MQSTGALNLGIGLTGVKEKRGPTCHISLSPAYSVSFSFLPSRCRRPAPESSRRRIHPSAAATPCRRLCTPSLALHAPPRPRSSAAAAARRQRRRRSHFARAPPTCAACTRLHRQVPPSYSPPRHPRRSHSLHASKPPHRSRRSRSCSTLTRCSRFCLKEMGREKRKGKEVVVEKPIRKQTRAERERPRGPSW